MIAAPGTTANTATPPAASLKRRLVSLIYESLILTAVLLAAALPVVILTRSWEHTAARTVLQIGLILVCGCFYTWQWSGAGQTLPMKTWRLRLINRDGSTVNIQRAWIRFFGALLSTSTLGLGFLWALIDRDSQFLHDRLAGTRLVMDTEAIT